MLAQALRQRPHQPAAGLTLFELVLALALLSALALVAVPSLAPLDATRLDVAASEVASAMRYARSEAIRRGSQGDAALTRMIGFDASSTTHHVRVSDWSGFVRVGPWPHPLDHNAYDIDLYNGFETRGVTISATTFTNAGGTSVGAVAGFTQDGNPIQFQASGSSGTVWALSSGMVEVSYGGRRRQVTLDATGRVSIGSLL